MFGFTFANDKSNIWYWASFLQKQTVVTMGDISDALRGISFLEVSTSSRLGHQMYRPGSF